MLDRLAYTAMTGAKHTMGQLAVTANNIANANTPGFREMVSAFRAVPVKGDGAPTRTFVVDSTPGSNFRPGTIEQTGNPLDVALGNDGFFAVRRDDGSEAYTRSGRFYTDENGLLKLGKGLTVVGEAGDITIPAGANVEIGKDGMVSTRLHNERVPNQIGRLKLVRPDEAQLTRAQDGLFQLPNGEVAPDEPAVLVHQGAIETSNVSVAGAMVQMITQTRMYELNVRMMQTADQNGRSANSLLSLSRV